MNALNTQTRLSDIEFMAIAKRIESLLQKADSLLLEARKAHIKDSQADNVAAA